MTDHVLIRCPGCEAIVNPERAACPGCGRCLNCGTIRINVVAPCPTCEIPYCGCCGRCPECGELRNTDVGLCECGHPDDKSQLASLIRYNAVAGAEKRPLPLGCVILITIVALVVVLGNVGFMVWR